MKTCIPFILLLFPKKTNFILWKFGHLKIGNYGNLIIYTKISKFAAKKSIQPSNGRDKKPQKSTDQFGKAPRRA